MDCPGVSCCSEGRCVTSLTTCFPPCNNDFNCGADLDVCCFDLVGSAGALGVEASYNIIEGYCVNDEIIEWFNTLSDAVVGTLISGFGEVQAECRPRGRKIVIGVGCAVVGILLIVLIVCIVKKN